MVTEDNVAVYRSSVPRISPLPAATKDAGVISDAEELPLPEKKAPQRQAEKTGSDDMGKIHTRTTGTVRVRADKRGAVVCDYAR